MKKNTNTIVTFVFLGTISFLLTSWGNDVHLDPCSKDPLSKSTGANGGYAGDPYNGNKNCTNCHAGTATTISGLITTNIPVSGYVPGTVYNITTSKSSPGISDFGFQTTAQNAAGAQIGTLAPLDGTTGAKLLGAIIYINQTATSNTGTNSKSWTYNWTAPATGSGPVTFYGAFLEGNGAGTGGDFTYISTHTINESTVGINEIIQPKISIYPNPVSNRLYIDYNNFGLFNDCKISIANHLGQIFYNQSINQKITTIDLSTWTGTGIYFVQIIDSFNNVIDLQKVIVQ